MQNDVVLDLGDQLDALARELSDDPLGGAPEVLSLAFDATARRVAVGMPGRVCVYSLHEGELVDTHALVEVSAHAPVRLAFTSDGKHVAAGTIQLVGNSDTLASVFLLTEGKQKPVLGVPGAKALEKHDWDLQPTSGVQVWTLSPDGDRLATAWDVQGVALWNVTTRRRERIVIKAPSAESDADPIEINALAFSPDGDEIAILVAGALELHPSGKGKRRARVEIDETFGASKLAYTTEGIVWARAAPGVSETCLVDPQSSTIARRPIALDNVRPLRIDATSVLWRQDVGEGDAREQVLVRQDLVNGHLTELARAASSDDPLHPRGVLTVSLAQDRIARCDGRTVRVSPLGH